MAAPEGGLDVAFAQGGELLDPFSVLGEVAVSFGAEEGGHFVSQKLPCDMPPFSL